MNLLFLIIPLLVFSIPMVFAESSNVGTMYWKQEIISPNSFVDIYVNDNDMNKKEYPNFADKFMISIWSDSSPNGLEIQVVETGVYSGIFKGRVFVADSGETVKNRLVSMPGDTVYAKYVDFTMPDGSTSEIFSAAVVKISGQNMQPLLDNIDSKYRMSSSIEKVPSWIKNNAGWWANDDIDDDAFIQGIQFLIKEKILEINETSSTEKSDKIPAWVKNNAGWWAEGQITESDFLSGITHLVKTGIISVSDDSVELVSDDVDPLLAECQSIKSTYKRLNCEKEIKQNLEFIEFKKSSNEYGVGPITYYYPGIGNFGNEFEISSSGQAMLRLRILAENTGNEVISLKCTGPSICSYDVWDGSKAFKYAGMDFVSGQIPINPGTSVIFNMMFGPNIGYGGNQFEYDSSKNYTFRVNENFGSIEIPLKIE
ncbi:MAG: hypothetical protein HPQ69_02855 [Marine Group I thaumarchaeote]|jgi:hypothetical protein|nr:MAG: hypothetical protein HPQ69_02855 [Marine Group I thaumarchaeote]